MFPFNEIVFGTLLLLISYQYRELESSDRKNFIKNDSKVRAIPEYDFIVVGGGSAGCIVANRLSERFTVLLLEVGGSPVSAVYPPINFGLLMQAPELIHTWRSEPQKYEALAKTGLPLNPALQTVGSVQGKSLGGTAMINSMLYNRGHPQDYNRWAAFTQDPSWNYQNLLPFFKRNERFQSERGDQRRRNSELGYEGALNLINDQSLFEPKDRAWGQAWASAGRALGYKEFSNSNGPQTEGFGSNTEIKLNNRRLTPYDAFIAPIMNKRTNLKIERYSDVKEIRFDGNGRATGVLYKRHGINKFAKASKEIVLSAGGFNSPKILLKSGVGPKEHLAEADIPLVANVPVGDAFQDHVVVYLDNFILTRDNLPYRNVTEQAFEDFEKHGKGPLSITSHGFAQAFIVSEENKAKSNATEWPDISLYAYYLDATSTASAKISIVVGLGLSSSFGSLRLNTTDPHNAPVVWDPNYLSADSDVKILREALQITTKIFQTDAFAKMGVRVDTTPIARCSDYSFGTDMYWNCFINGISSNSHPAATCPMGPVEYRRTVVDSKLRVLGVTGVRVIDSSVQPFLTNTNGNSAPVMVIAQRGSQFIIDEYSH